MLTISVVARLARLTALPLLTLAGSASNSFAQTATPVPLLSGAGLLDVLIHVGPIIIALIAVVLAYYPLRAIKQIEQEKIEAEKKKFALEEKRFLAEEEQRRKSSEYRHQEAMRFSPIAAEIAKELSDILRVDSSWARQALEAAKIAPYTDRIFGERFQHFQNEKNELAEDFTQLLLKRCEAHARSNKEIFLTLDAGTTLYPFFELIGREAARLRQLRGEGANWLERLHLFTNNLPGFEQLIRFGKIAPNDRYSDLAIADCQILPGVALPVFGAVASTETSNAIEVLGRRKADRSTVFIALVVGNWVRIRRSEPPCPIPMARGVDHHRVKQALVKNADEIFVISPLGKTFVGQSEDSINEVLGYSSATNDPEKACYKDIDITNEQARRVRLVTTRRKPGQLLSRHSDRVEDVVNDGRHEILSEDDFATRPIEHIPHIIFDLNKPLGNMDSQRESEFPHRHTRYKAKFLEMFSVGV